jgi:hypothetical protein
MSTDMKKICITLVLTIIFCVTGVRPASAGDPVTQMIIEMVKKVIKAIDLAIQRLQLATIELQNAQKAVENAMSKLKLDEIFQWTEKQRQLFAGYYDELWRVKSIIATYKRTKAIVENQVRVIEEYRRAVALFEGDKHFSADDLEGMMKVYLGILNESIQNVQQITMVINAFSTQMTDAKRLEIIKDTDERVQRNLNDLRSFTQENIMARMQKARDEYELSALRRYYGLQE